MGLTIKFKISQTLISQTFLAGAASWAYARYADSTFRIFKLPNVAPENAACMLGAGITSVVYFIDRLISKKIDSYIPRSLLSVGITGTALGALTYSKRFVELTTKEAGSLFLIASFFHLIFSHLRNSPVKPKKQPPSTPQTGPSPSIPPNDQTSNPNTGNSGDRIGSGSTGYAYAVKSQQTIDVTHNVSKNPDYTF